MWILNHVYQNSEHCQIVVFHRKEIIQYCKYCISLNTIAPGTVADNEPLSLSDFHEIHKMYSSVCQLQVTTISSRYILNWLRYRGWKSEVGRAFIQVGTLIHRNTVLWITPPNQHCCVYNPLFHKTSPVPSLQQHYYQLAYLAMLFILELACTASKCTPAQE